MSWLLLGQRFPPLDHSLVPVELGMGEEVVADYSRQCVAPPCGYFGVSLAVAEVGVAAEDDLEVEDSPEVKVELVVKAGEAAAAGYRWHCPKTLVSLELGPLLPLPSRADEL